MPKFCAMTTDDGFLAKPYAPKIQQAIDSEMDKFERNSTSDIDSLLEEFAQPSYQQQWNRDVNPKSNLKIPKKNRTRRKNVNTMTRRELIYHLGAMELPETNARDFNDSEIRDILVSQAPDMFFSSVKP